MQPGGELIRKGRVEVRDVEKDSALCGVLAGLGSTLAVDMLSLLHVEPVVPEFVVGVICSGAASRLNSRR